jgi:NADPH:quinone reductase-like Zn-dependent oxidoreductase
VSSAVIDPVGGAASEQALRSVRWGGTFVTLGYASGTIPKIPLNLVLLKGVTVKGMEIRTFGQHLPELERRDREELLDLFAAGRLRPHIGARFPLSDAAAALRYVADRRALGKVVIDVGLPPPRSQARGQRYTEPLLSGVSRVRGTFSGCGWSAGAG